MPIVGLSMNSVTCSILERTETILHTTSFLAGGQKGASKETVNFLQNEVMFPKRQNQPDIPADTQHNEDTIKKNCPKQDRSKSKSRKLSSSFTLVSAA